MSYNFGFRRPGKTADVVEFKHRTFGEEVKSIEKLINKYRKPDVTLDVLFMFNAKMARRGQYGLALVQKWIEEFDEITHELQRRKMNIIKYTGFLISWGIYRHYVALIKDFRNWFYQTGHLWFLKLNLRTPPDLKIHSPALRSKSGLLRPFLTEDGAWGFEPFKNEPTPYVDRFTFISHESIFESLSSDDELKQPLADYLSKPRRRYRSKLKPYVPSRRDTLNLTDHWRYENHFRGHSGDVAFIATQDGKN